MNSARSESSAPQRKPTNVSLDPALLEKARRWRDENAEAIAASNRYVDANGLPLADFRQF